ncbi:MAG TPA: RagB/SusD family nutrient uptake outer membrane protein [Gemmatimonadales bacterium]|nr:RagB/SusD family nutrient uptake outer membrane protein [Gemmatimonadales bacterium]
MTTKLSIRSVRAGALVTALVVTTACSAFFDVPNTNQPNLEDLVNNPTRSKLVGAATGVFSSARSGIQNYIWRLGSLGREGINLSGNNQPDYSEPYFGPLQSTGFGGSQWTDRYQHIRNLNVFLDALARVSTAEVSDSEKAAGRAMANTLKALAFMHVIFTRDTIGAPVDVDQPITAAPAQFVTKDSVYGYALALLDSANADLPRANRFWFPVPPGFTGFDTPATFGAFNRALAAKAEVMRGSAAACGASCYDKAITALAGSFLVADSTQFGLGVYFDFLSEPGGTTNGLSEPLNGVTFFAHPSDSLDAQLQPGGQSDQRVLNKIAAKQGAPQQLGGIPQISGTQKFTIYLTGGQADPGHPIPIIRNEELVLLDAEAQWFRSAPNKLQAIADINLVRQGAGHLAVTTVTALSPDSDFVKELIYNRRYSLLWEQGTRWLDARRFNRLSDIINEAPSLPFVPTVMPLPKAECDRRGLGDNCQPPRS